ncbi:HNH endonuclease [Bosea sp. BK604]|uniref:HNH endonuclease n=1 Tax=Bosea sp. BK604 TaxID=2512180 RepID=UPI0010446E42|nr:HNH endonuclease [Bosea sp. BK604]
MIKLDRAADPLDPDEVKQLTEHFIRTGESVWNMENLKQSLNAMSHGKCCYCETNTNEESKYMEVEHFRCKKNHRNDVLKWSNLLPSCKRCNGRKHEHDVTTEGEIIDPSVDDPRDHIFISNYRMRPRTEKGKMTIDVVDLNDYLRAVTKRFKIGEIFYKMLDDLTEMINTAQFPLHATRRNRILNKMESILGECQRYNAYSATSATIVLTSTEFQSSKLWLQQAGLWSAKLQSLEDEADKIMLAIA